MSRSLLLFIALLLAAFAAAQDNTPPEVRLIIPKTAKPGAKVVATIQVTFAEGLHGYQNPPSPDYLIPVKVQAPKGLKVLKIEYPKGVLLPSPGEPKPVAVYDGAIKIPVTFFAPTKPGALALKFTLTYQQCNAEVCFPPGSATLEGKLIVKK